MGDKTLLVQTPFTLQDNCTAKCVVGSSAQYQVDSQDAFLPGWGINETYADGVSITYGQPCTHIWSYVGGYIDFLGTHNNTCPCIHSDTTQPPEFVGDNYYYESANEEPLHIFAGQLFLLLTSCGMGNSVTMKVLAVPLSLLHGSAWSCLILQKLKYAYMWQWRYW